MDIKKYKFILYILLAILFLVALCIFAYSQLSQEERPFIPNIGTASQSSEETAAPLETDAQETSPSAKSTSPSEKTDD